LNKRIPMSAKKPLSLVSVPIAPRKFTGRFLVRLDGKTNTAAVIRAAKAVGLRLTLSAAGSASTLTTASGGVPAADDRLSRTLGRSDGVIFGRLQIVTISIPFFR
jgi:hypothetical protein